MMHTIPWLLGHRRDSDGILHINFSAPVPVMVAICIAHVGIVLTPSPVYSGNLTTAYNQEGMFIQMRTADGKVLKTLEVLV